MNNRRAALWMIGAIFSFTSMAIAGRAISGQLDTFEIMFYRSIMGFLIVLAVAKTVGTLGEIDLKHFRLHLLRNIFHFTGQNLWFFALPLIPLAQLFARVHLTHLGVTLGPNLFRRRVNPPQIGDCGLGLHRRFDRSPARNWCGKHRHFGRGLCGHWICRRGDFDP